MLSTHIEPVLVTGDSWKRTATTVSSTTPQEALTATDSPSLIIRVESLSHSVANSQIVFVHCQTYQRSLPTCFGSDGLSSLDFIKMLYERDVG